MFLAKSGFYVYKVTLEQAPVEVAAYQPPPGYALVPINEVSDQDISQACACSATIHITIQLLNQNCPNYSISKIFRFQLQTNVDSSPRPSYDKAVA